MDKLEISGAGEAAPAVLLPEDREEFLASVEPEHLVEAEQEWNSMVDQAEERQQDAERKRRTNVRPVDGPSQQGYQVLYLSLNQIATRWGVCQRTVWRYVKSGRLRSWRVGGVRRVVRADVEAVEAAGLAEAV